MKNLAKVFSVRLLEGLLVSMAMLCGVTTSLGQQSRTTSAHRGADQLQISISHQSLTVTTQNDSVASDPTTSPLTAFGSISLRSAIQFSNSNTVFVVVDTIFVPEGTYILDHVAASDGGVADDSARAGDLDINTSLVIAGSGMSSTFIDGNGTDRVFSINPKLNSTPTVKMSQLTIKNGVTPSGSGEDGGGIEIQNANVTLDTVAVDSNSADNNGGGINISPDGGTLTMNGGTVNFNDASNSFDGGGGVLLNTGTVTLNNVDVSYNVSGWDGGGVANLGADVTMSGCTVSHNQAPNDLGGGIHTQAGAFTITNSLIDANGSPAGAGISMFSGVTISGSTIKRNRASYGSDGGGGIRNSGADLKISSSSIDSNYTAGKGGALWIYGTSTDTLLNVTIDRDTAATDGAGVFDQTGGTYWNTGFLTNNVVVAGGTTYAFTNTSGADYVLNVTMSGNVPHDYSGSVVLPVELASVKATADAGMVTLTWQTATEVNNAGFNVLRKTQGPSSFALVATYQSDASLRGAGTSNSPRQYSYVDENVCSGLSYSYRIQSVTTDGTVKDGSTVTVAVGVPESYALYQNFPNPFNPSTTIRFDLKEPSTVSLQVYNLLGQRVLSEDRGMMNAGSYNENIDMSRFASGVYIYRIAAIGTSGEKFVALKRMMLVK